MQATAARLQPRRRRDLRRRRRRAASSAINPEIPAASFSRPDSELVRAALAGGASGWHVDEVGSGDVIRGAVPIRRVAAPGKAAGAVVVNVLIPFSQARKVASIRSTLDEYRQLQPTAGHVRSAYLLELLLAFIMVLMLALWMGFRLASGVTGPMRALAEGTADVARGNLDVRGAGRHRRRGRVARRLVQPDDPRPARRADRHRAQGHRARAAAPLHGDRARQRRRGRRVRRTPTGASARSTRRRSASSASRPAAGLLGQRLEDVAQPPGAARGDRRDVAARCGRACARACAARCRSRSTTTSRRCSSR